MTVGAAGDRPAGHPLRPSECDSLPIPHSSRRDSPLLFGVIARFLVRVFLSEVKNSLSLITPGDGRGQARAVCYLPGPSFLFPF